MKILKSACALLLAPLMLCSCSGSSKKPENTPSQFMDCILPMPIIGELSDDCWGASEVGARDQDNGLEDKNLDRSDVPGTKYCYWDGSILKDEETGKYYMFASRWEESAGHWGWPYSKAVYAVSDNLYGPYEDRGLVYPNIGGGDGHNVFVLKLKDGEDYYGRPIKYAMVLGDTANDMLRGGVLVSDSLEGPWRLTGTMEVKGGAFWLSNVGIVLGPDDKYYAYNRNGDIAVADTIMGPWESKVENLWNKIDVLKGQTDVEDPVMWYSDGVFNCVVNRWDERKAYYLTSKDGINDWKAYEGAAYMPDAEFTRYENGESNHWNKIERPNVYIEDGKVKAMTFAVIDVPKDNEVGNDGHGSKVIVIPFDSDALSNFIKYGNKS